MVRQTLIFAAALVFSGCVYGPKTEEKSPLNASVDIPIVKRKEGTEVQGKVMMMAGLGAVPVQGVEIGLFSEDGKMLANGTSGIGGEFSLRAPVKNGVYKLKTLGEKYTGSYPVAVQSYSVSGILFQVQKND